MKSIVAPALLVSLLLAGASCETQRESPPVAVETKVAVPVPCDIPEPQCVAPAYDAARKEQPGDVKVRLLRAESITQADCLRRFKEALAACREPPLKR